MFRHPQNHWPKILTAAVVTAVGLLVFKYLPMSIWGREILFDASGHVASAIFVLYVLWFFIDQNKSWRMPFLIFSALVLFVIAVQRIIDNAHNDIGLLGGLALGLVAIAAAERKNVRKKLRF